MPRARRTRPERPRRVRITAEPREGSSTGAAAAPLAGALDFCGQMQRLCEDIIARVPGLSHVRMEDVLVTVTRSRGRGRTGLWAKLTPMRFAGGARVGQRRGRPYLIEPLLVEGREVLYILTFCLPRFLNLTYREKLETVCHELFHVGPKSDGDYRRFSGRYHVHSARASRFDEAAERLCDDYLATRPPASTRSFLRFRLAELLRRHHAIEGVTIPVPKLVPLEEAA